jgi:hypothetical protein
MEAPGTPTAKRGNNEDDPEHHHYPDDDHHHYGGGSAGDNLPLTKRLRLLRDSGERDDMTPGDGSGGDKDRHDGRPADGYSPSEPVATGGFTVVDTNTILDDIEPSPGDSGLPVATTFTATISADKPAAGRPMPPNDSSAASGSVSASLDAVQHQVVNHHFALNQQQHLLPSSVAAYQNYPHEQASAAAVAAAAAAMPFLDPRLFGAGGGASLFSAPQQLMFPHSLPFGPQLAAAAAMASAAAATNNNVNVNPYYSSVWTAAAGLGPPPLPTGHHHPTGSGFLPSNAGLMVVPPGLEQSAAAVAAASAGMGYPLPMRGLDFQSTASMAASAVAAAAAAELAARQLNANLGRRDGDDEEEVRATSYGGDEKPRVFPMSHPTDEATISKYQCLLRKQIEFFEAKAVDLKARAQGRNVPIREG